MKKYVTFRALNGTIHFQAERRSVWLALAFAAATLLAIVAGTGWGSTMISPLEVLQSILGIGSGKHQFLIQTLRLPRVLTALLAGAALGVSGAILQSMIRNPLASPDLMGMTGGAAASAVAFITYGGGVSIRLLPAAAFVGALVVSLLVYFLSWKKGVTPIRLVLIGIGLSAGTTAATTFMLVVSPLNSAGQAYLWMVGSVYGAKWEHVYTVAPVVLLGLPLALLFARSLGAQELGDDVARGLGVTVQRHRLALLLLSVALAGAAVAVAGTIGFVGLIAPHIARQLAGRAPGAQLLLAAFVGALLVFAADLVARTALYPLDIPAGVFTAGVGAPFFLYLLFRNRNRL